MPNPGHSPSPHGGELDIKNILLLDDDEDLANVLKELLEMRNFIVTTVRNGVDGLKEVLSMDFDVIVCDMMMPHMRGDMFYIAVQKVKPHLTKRFVFVTGFPGKPEVEKFVNETNVLVLRKPVTTEDLIRMVSLALKRAEE